MIVPGGIVGNAGGPVVALDFIHEVAKGNIPRHSIMSAMGERSSIGTTAEGEDVWRGNELTPAPTSTTKIPTPDSGGEQMTVVAENVNDTAAGTGARTLELHYIDTAGVEQMEVISLNGTTEVDTVATDIIFVNDLHVLTAGAGLLPAGYIKIYKKGSAGLVYNMLSPGENKSLVPHRMVPAGKILVLRSWFATEAKAKRAVYRIRSTDHDGVLLPNIFNFKDTCYLNNSTSGQLSIDVIIPAFSIIKVTAWADISGAEGSCSWRGVLVDE